MTDLSLLHIEIMARVEQTAAEEYEPESYGMRLDTYVDQCQRDIHYKFDALVEILIEKFPG